MTWIPAQSRFGVRGGSCARTLATTGRAPSDDHNMITSAAAAADEMKFEAFVGSPHADYVSSIKEAWRRQILFVKDTDPLGPNYTVICDTLGRPDKRAKWRLWCTSDKIDLHNQSTVSAARKTWTWRSILPCPISP